MELLLNKGARVEYSDPHIPCLPLMRHYPTLRMASQELSPEYLGKVDAVVVVTDHSAFDWDFVLKHAALVVDTRNATRGAIGAARVVRA
jgi:UDP-N-acetyl-D-glucosamine dehydrogenase